ncbi:hypothetical protein J4Q44_G00194290 [Coregonus suidteri]|uniref:Fibronectin type-III domain-containing protein n=1 Tax=Coregonus suidteri TaxID=861788 RepID=A0AAN8LFE6_9TELE
MSVEPGPQQLKLGVGSGCRAVSTSEPDSAHLNTQYILTWDWDQTTTGNAVTFTAEYIAVFEMKMKKDWSRVCDGTTHTRCDLTGSDLLYLGRYMLRVRASAGGLHSHWVYKDFCPHIDASLGPPSRVELAPVGEPAGSEHLWPPDQHQGSMKAPVGNQLDVNISDPLTSTQGSMEDHIPSLYYHILYWSRSDDPQGLNPKVEVSSENLTSGYTAPQCMQTEGDTPYWQIFLYFLVSMVVCFLFVLLPSYAAFRFYRVLKYAFYPSIQLPAHIQEYLCDSSPASRSDIPRLLTAKAELCSPPSELEQDSGRHSRQGSGDSGVYSTEGGSAQQGRSGGESIRRDQEVDSWQTLEQVKMEEIGRESTDERVLDEGVVDVGV